MPGGSGVGKPYTFQEEPWGMQGAAREAQEAPGLEAARQREAAEAVCRANPSACMGSTQGEGPQGEGPEEYDPEGLASYKTTLKRAQELRNDAANGLAVGILVDIGIPGTAEGGADYAVELEISALNLEACVEVGKGTPGKGGERWCMLYQ
jgi:hypothetical protein